eukprot:3634406-Amphidinium_carterae.1
MMREIELAGARVEHVQFDDGDLVVRWLLPTSKTDPEAFGTVRAWRCLCRGFGDKLCPYHVVKDQVALVNNGWLFPTSE